MEPPASSSDLYLAPLHSLPIEMVSHILWFVGEDYRSAIRCGWVCRIFRSLVEEIRFKSREEMLKSRILRGLPWIRRVDGYVHLGEVEELEEVSERLEGNMYIVFPHVREEGGTIEWSFVPEARKSLNLYDYLTKVLVQVLEIVMKKVEKYPSSEVNIQIDDGLCVQWSQGRCQLSIPLVIDKNSSLELLSDVLVVLEKFLNVVPITTLSYTPIIVTSTSLRWARGHAVSKVLFESRTARALKVLIVNPDVAALPLCLSDKQLESLHTLLPSVDSLDFSFAFCSSRSIGTTRKSQLLKRSYTDICQLPTSFTSRIVSINKPTILFFQPQDLGTYPSPEVFMAKFPKVRNWIVVVREANANVPRGLYRGSQIASLLSTAPPDPSTDAFRTFWLKYKENREFIVLFK